MQLRGVCGAGVSCTLDGALCAKLLCSCWQLSLPPHRRLKRELHAQHRLTAHLQQVRSFRPLICGCGSLHTVFVCCSVSTAAKADRVAAAQQAAVSSGRLTYRCCAAPHLRPAQAVADCRLPLDAAVSAVIKTVVILLPLLVRLSSGLLWPAGCSSSSGWLLDAARSWALSVSHQLTSVIAGGLPLAAALFSPYSYHCVRDSLLFLVQSLLLVMLRKPLLATPGAAVAAAATSGGQPFLFHSCAAAVLLLLFQQRLSWALWQVFWDLGACLVLMYADKASLLQLPASGWLQLLLPLATLPVLYMCERVDRYERVC